MRQIFEKHGKVASCFSILGTIFPFFEGRTGEGILGLLPLSFRPFPPHTLPDPSKGEKATRNGKERIRAPASPINGKEGSGLKPHSPSPWKASFSPKVPRFHCVACRGIRIFD